MDELKYFKPEVNTPKKVDSNGYDEDGVLHDKCGTPECCQQCNTPEGETTNDNEVTNRPNIS